MDKSIQFQDTQLAMDLPCTTVGPITTQDLVRWAGASGDYNPIHYDKDAALTQGLPSVVVPGPFRMAMVAAMIIRWIGPQGRLKKLSCSYKGLDLPGDTLTCGGKVVNKFINEVGGKYVDCEIWVKNPREKSTVGTARVLLP